MAKRGRPSEYTPETATKICFELSQGISLRTVCESDEMPATSTVFLWLQKYPEFTEQYARAKVSSAEAMAEDILDIADNSVNDWMEIHYGKDSNDVAWKVNNEAVQRSKLRVDSRRWLMSKMMPKKYGDKLDVQQTHVIFSLADIAKTADAIESARHQALPPEYTVLPENGLV